MYAISRVGRVDFFRFPWPETIARRERESQREENEKARAVKETRGMKRCPLIIHALQSDM